MPSDSGLCPVTKFVRVGALDNPDGQMSLPLIEAHQASLRGAN